MWLVRVAEALGRSGVECVRLGTMWRPEDWDIGHLCAHSLLLAWWEIYSKALVAEAGVGGSAKASAPVGDPAVSLVFKSIDHLSSVYLCVIVRPSCQVAII